MAEYIDLNEAIIAFGFEWDDIAPTRDEFINFLKSRKRANVKEIVCANWEKADGMGYYRCSHYKTVDDKYYQPEYCPHCGAEMIEVK